MDLSPAQRLERSCRRLDERLQDLKAEEQRIRGTTPGIWRVAADVLGAAGGVRDIYRACTASSERILGDARAALQRGDLAGASRFLETADVEVRRADDAWNHLVGMSARGARVGIAVIAVAGIAATGGLGAYALGGGAAAVGVATALGVHSAGIGGAWILLSDIGNPALGQTHLQDEIAQAGVEDFTALTKKTVTPPKDTLERHALQRLEEWQACQRDPSQACALPTDIGRFLLAAEAADPKIKLDTDVAAILKERWEQEEIAAIRAAAEGKRGDEAVAAVMRTLHERGIGHYKGDNGLLSDALRGAGGNCSSRAKRIIAAMAAAGVRLPPSQTFALQSFNGHLTAVVFDGDRGDVWDLATNRRHTGRLRAHLYHPQALYHMFLGNDSPLADRDFLIAAAEADARQPPPLPPTNENLTPLEGVNAYDGALDVDEAFEPSPYALAPPPEAQGAAEEATAAASLHELSRAERKFFAERMRDGNLFAYDEQARRFIFRTQAHARHFNDVAALPTKEAQRHFLIELAQHSIEQRLASPEVRAAMEILTTPQKAKGSPASTIDKAREAFNEASHLAFAQANGIATWDGSVSERSLEAMIKDRSIPLSLLKRKRTALQKSIAEQPLPMVQLFNELPSPARRPFMDLLAAGEPRDALRPLFDAIADPHLVGVGEPSAAAPPTLSVELRLDETGASAPQAHLDTPLLENKGPTEKQLPSTTSLADDAHAAVHISAECMIDLLLIADPKDATREEDVRLVRRWTAKLLREFRRLNQGGTRDLEFLCKYGLIAWNSGPDEAAARDPIPMAFKRNNGLRDFEFGSYVTVQQRLVFVDMVPADLALILKDIRRRLRLDSFSKKFATLELAPRG
jgi:hypothetical protein